jgi:DNA-binding LacI/PurR family transcriptional regulator
MAQQLYATVGGDNQRGGQLATQHLLAQGARRVLFMGDPELPEVGQRYQGYLQAHAAAGVAVDAALCRPVPFVTEAVVAEMDLLARQKTPFDAVFAASDLTAMSVISALRQQGRRVPEDVRVVGYDDIALAAHFHPPLSTVRQPIAQAGQALVQLLMSQRAGERQRSTLLDTELVVRQSSAV